MSAAGKIIVIGLAALAFVGCDDKTPQPAPKGAASASAASSARATSGWQPSHTAKTTSYAMAVRNHDRQIEDTERRLEKDPDDLGIMSKLVGQLMTSSSRLGRLAALDRVVALGERAVDKHPEKAEAHLLRARTRGAVHRFDEALADLKKAEQLGAEASETRLNRATVLLGLGKYDEALKLARRAMQDRKTPTTLTIVAAILGRMGKVDEAEKLFAEAEKSYIGTNPFQLAWIYFEWGSMYDRAGRADEARARYRAAVERLPGYAHAAAHLAWLTSPAEAKALLKPVLESSDDPEYVAMMASFKEKEMPGSGEAMMGKAKRRYAELMDKHPLAFADHAGWFYLEMAKDVDRAVEVAEMNLKARQVPEAYELAIAALEAAEETDEACRRADEALAQPYPSLGVKVLAVRAYEGCGKKDRAAELKKVVAKARAAR